MPLIPQNVEFPFIEGVDEKTRSELLPDGRFTAISNLVQNKTGALEKAPGQAAAYSTNAANALGVNYITSLHSVFAYKDETCLIGGNLSSSYPFNAYTLSNSVFSYNSQTTAWKHHGVPAEAYISSRKAVGSGIICDQIISNGTLAVLYVSQAGFAHVVLFSASTGEMIISPSLISTTSTIGNLRLATDGTYIYWIRVTGAGVMKYARIASSSPVSWSAEDFLAFGHPAVTSGTLTTHSTGTHFYVGYASTAGHAHAIAFDGVNPPAGLGILDTDTTVTAVGLGGNESDTIWVAYTKGQTVKVLGLDSLFAGVTATVATVITAAGVEVLYSLGIVPTGTRTGLLTAGNDSTGVQSMYVQRFNVTAGAVTSAFASDKYYHMVPASQPWRINTRPYQLVSYQTSTAANAQKYLYAIDLSAPAQFTNRARAVACISPRLATLPNNTISLSPMPSVPVSGTTALVPVTIVKSGVVQGIEAVTLEFSSYANYSRAPYLDVMALGCGVPAFYDGTSTTEQVFLVAPEIISLTPGGAAATFPIAGSWNYVVVWEHVDARGQVHRSAPSAPVNYTNGSGAGVAQVVVTFNSLSLTTRDVFDNLNSGPVLGVVYRTASAGSIYYRVGTVANAAGTGSLQYTDTTADAALTANALLYTQPGTSGTSLPRVNPPSFTQLISHNDLLWGITGNDVWYSGQPVSGEGPWWSDAFQFSVNAGIGPLTGMASMDGRLILFKRNKIFVVDGRGASDNGTGNDVSAPSELPVEVGCVNHRSICVTSEGVWFHSLRGLELLSRSLQLENFAGQAVEDTVGPTAVVANATLNERVGRVAFVVRPSESAFTSTFVYRDLVHKTWTVKVVGGGSIAVRSAALVGSSAGTMPTYVFGTDSGSVYPESLTDYTDRTVSSYHSSSFTTGSVNLAGVLGFQRVRNIYLYAVRSGAHDLTVLVDYNDEGTFSETHTYTDSTINTLVVSGKYMLRIRPYRQRCRSVSLRVTDSYSGAASAGAIYLGLRFEIAVKRGGPRLSSAAST